MANQEAPLDLAADRLKNALTGALIRELRRQESIALAFSGGLDSTVLARILSELSDIDVFLVTVGVPGSRDATRARERAKDVALPLIEVPVSEGQLLEALRTVVPIVGRTPIPAALAERWELPAGSEHVSPVLCAIEATLYLAFRAAAPHAKRVLLGQGGDELFGGYKRYETLEGEALRARMGEDLASLTALQRPIEERVGTAAGVKARYPYLDAEVVRLSQTFPVELLVSGGERKIVLRRLAKRLGLPREAWEVPKTAAQYGSGLAGLLDALARRQGRSPGELVNSLASA